MAWHVKIKSLFLILFSFVVICETLVKEPFYRYDTAYACEGKTLRIQCGEGEIIKLIRANYGRFSITICNDHGNTEWSVNCMSPKSLRVLHSRCTHNQNCSIPASTSMFGDPCAGTHKYLEAHYQCVPAATSTTTNRPSPPWLITSQPPMWTTVRSATKPALVTKAPVSSTLSKEVTLSNVSPSTTSANASSHAGPIQVPDDENISREDFSKGEDFDVSSNPLPNEITTLPFTTYNPRKFSSEGTVTHNQNTLSSSVLPPWDKDVEISDYCSPKMVRTIFWNWTRVMETNIQPCPGGTTGFAKWRCIKTEYNAESNSNTRWFPQSPDLSGCRSVWLTSLEQRLSVGRDPLVSITNDLAQVTGSKVLYGGDMMMTTKIIKTMTLKMSKDIQTFPDTRQREAFVTEMLTDVVRTSSNLLDSSQHPSWRDLSYEEQMRVATSLLIGLEENAFLLAETVSRKKVVNQVVKNIMLSVRILETKSVTTERFSLGSDWSASNDTIELAQGALLDNSDGGLIRLVFVAFDRLEEILQWHPGFDENNKNISKVLNSKIMCASLGKGRHIQLKEPVRLIFKHIHTDNVTNPSCVFWDYSMNSWSKEGCQIEATNTTHTVCLCNHLTNFAILMDVRAIYLPVPHQIALQIITYIGCIISIICLILAVITFQCFRGLKSDRTTIHFNLCVCLLLAELLFIVGIGQTQNKIACGVVAGFLQYFFLCSFAWMFFEGVQLYVMLIEIFEAEKSRIRWYYFLAYGVPLLIVFTSAIIYPQGYGTDRFCWLKTDNYFIFTFIVPVVLVLTLNFIFLILAIVMMCRHASTSMSIKNKEHSRLASTRVWIRGAIVLVVLLGLTWTFGFLYVNEETIAMAYIFAVLNSLQGFFIFLFHCVQNEKVRKEYRKFIRRHSWLPVCLQCSKGNTAGISSSSGSSGAIKERSLYGTSNGNPSTGLHSSESTSLPAHGTTSVGTNTILISSNLNNARPTGLVQVVARPDLNNASTTTISHNRLHNASQQVAAQLELPEQYQRSRNLSPYLHLGQHDMYCGYPNLPPFVKPFPFSGSST